MKSLFAILIVCFSFNLLAENRYIIRMPNAGAEAAELRPRTSFYDEETRTDIRPGAVESPTPARNHGDWLFGNIDTCHDCDYTNSLKDNDDSDNFDLIYEKLSSLGEQTERFCRINISLNESGLVWMSSRCGVTNPSLELLKGEAFSVGLVELILEEQMYQGGYRMVGLSSESSNSKTFYFSK